MGLGWYGKWMTRWETDLTTRDTNRVVRPLEWGFDWLADFSDAAGEAAEDAASQGIPQGLKPRINREIYGTDESVPLSKTGSAAASAVLAPMAEECADGTGSKVGGSGAGGAGLADLDRMIAVNEEIVRRSDDFFGY